MNFSPPIRRCFGWTLHTPPAATEKLEFTRSPFAKDGAMFPGGALSFPALQVAITVIPSETELVL